MAGRVDIFNETTHHSYSLEGPHETDDIFKVICSKVKVTDDFFGKCNFPAEEYRSTA